jgi:FkbM family methyltransferase
MTPVGMRRAVGKVVARATGLRADLQLARLRTQSAGSLVRYRNYRIRVNDGPSAYVGLKDIFVQRIYHFESRRANPLILDCGSNIGLSLLYFASTYPQSRIIAFEPDPTIFPCLQENTSLNGIRNARLVHAALSVGSGTMTLHSDGGCGSCLAQHASSGGPPPTSTHEVPSARLRDYLTEPVDFLKMNIEGAECEVLEDTEDRLPLVQEMVIEYHHLPGLPRTLHRILALLHRQGFEYLINSFDAITNPGSVPPFRLDRASRYFLLIYARAARMCPCILAIVFSL